MKSDQKGEGGDEPPARVRRAVKVAREYGYSVVPPKAEWQKLSVEVEKSLMKRFREVVQQRGMKLKYALSEALSDYIEKWKKAKEK